MHSITYCPFCQDQPPMTLLQCLRWFCKHSSTVHLHSIHRTIHRHGPCRSTSCDCLWRQFVATVATVYVSSVQWVAQLGGQGSNTRQTVAMAELWLPVRIRACTSLNLNQSTHTTSYLSPPKLRCWLWPFASKILVNVLQIFGTASQLIPIFHRSLDLSIV